MKETNKTVELEEYIKSRYVSVMKELGEIEPKVWIYFEQGFANSPEGTYAFYDGEKYHYLSTEKGRIVADEIMHNMGEIAYRVLDTLIHYYSFQYARDNRVEGIDSRRVAFGKQLEIYMLIDENFYKKKRKEIEKILEEYPYSDTK